MAHLKKIISLNVSLSNHYLSDLISYSGHIDQFNIRQVVLLREPLKEAEANICKKVKV